LAKPVALKELEASKEANRDKEKGDDDSKVIGLSLKALKRKAGEKMPGEDKSPLRLARGSLGPQFARSRWLDRKKLGIDRSEFWARV
jgi:hypothetical protein